MSVNSPTDICNLALDLLSAGTVQNVEEPSSPTEELLSRWYDLSRKKCLREHPWNFAAKRAILAASSTDPAFGYSKAFPVPADFVRILYISTDLVTDQDTILPADQYQFENGSILITSNYGDATSLNLVYIYDIKEVSSMDPMFIELLAYDIALNVAYKVTENNSNIQRIGELARMKKAIAKAIDGQERPPQRVEYSRALSARRNNTTRNAHRITF
jgi:hypothetical protein